MALDVVAQHTDRAVFFASLRIFIGIGARIDAVSLVLRHQTFIGFQAELRHFRLVKAYPAEHRAISIEGHR